jgi:hypothetical protein
MAGVPLLCCRGSHRKLERAKWNARAYLGAFDHQQQEEDQDVTHQESLSTLEDGDTSTGTQTLGGTTTQSKQVYYLVQYVLSLPTASAAHAVLFEYIWLNHVYFIDIDFVKKFPRKILVENKMSIL